MDGWMDGWAREDVEEYVEGWNVVTKFFHYDVSRGGRRGDIGVDEVLHFLRSMEPRYFSCY